MIRLLIPVVLSVVLRCSSAAQVEEPLRVDPCNVTQQAEKFAGKVIEVRAVQIKLKRGEWGLRVDCWPLVLLVLPKDVSPTPDFSLQKTPAFDMLLAARTERVSLTATFVGRFDWSGSGAPKGRNKLRLFGKSKMSARFVLQRVSDPQRIVLPYK